MSCLSFLSGAKSKFDNFTTYDKFARCLILREPTPSNRFFEANARSASRLRQMWPCLISEREGANVGNSGALINAQICGAGVGQFFRSDFLEFFVDSRILMHPSEANIFFRVLSPNWVGQYFSDAATLTAGMEPKYCLSPER